MIGVCDCAVAVALGVGVAVVVAVAASVAVTVPTAVVFATVNCVGGFMVTDRMLKMFKRK